MMSNLFLPSGSDLQRKLETCMAQQPNPPLEREVKFDLIGVGTAIYSPLAHVKNCYGKNHHHNSNAEVSVSIAL